MSRFKLILWYIFTIDIKYQIMKIEQIYTGCLAQGAYYIMSEGEVAIIDPLREVDRCAIVPFSFVGNDPLAP